MSHFDDEYGSEKDCPVVLKLLDLRKQATTEHSHYYTAQLVGEAIAEIRALRMLLVREHGRLLWAQRKIKNLRSK